MTTFTHVAVGLGIASFFPTIHPLWAIGFSLLPDLDHLLLLKTMRLEVGGMQHARTFLHELAGTVVFTACGIFLALLIDRTFGALFMTCILFHLFCDFINGYSTPFKHIRDVPSVDMGKFLPTRILQEVGIGVLSLWLFLTN